MFYGVPLLKKKEVQNAFMLRGGKNFDAAVTILVDNSMVVEFSGSRIMYQ